MAVVVDKYNEKTYSLVINSQDKISGTNNNATYQVNWDDFLPRDITNYKVLYAFRSAGGYYSDGLTKIPTTTGGANLLYSNSPYVTSIYSTVGTLAVGSNTFTVGTTTGANIVNGLYVFAMSTTNTALNCFPNGTTVIGTSGTGTGATVYFSNNSIYPLPTGSYIYMYNNANVSPVTYCSARLLLGFNTSSYSFDTSIKGQSINLGICQRDIQTSLSKSNTLSTFYCQIPPRCIVRPINNFINIQVLNNCYFAGGITSYSGTNPATYSLTPVNTNYLTDTNQVGSAIASSNDMTSYNLYLEFIPLK